MSRASSSPRLLDLLECQYADGQTGYLVISHAEEENPADPRPAGSGVTRSILETHERGPGGGQQRARAAWSSRLQQRERCAPREKKATSTPWPRPGLAKPGHSSGSPGIREFGGLTIKPEPSNAKKKHARGAAIERASSLHVSLLGSLTAQQWADRASELCDMHPGARKEGSGASTSPADHHSPDTTARV